MPGAPIEISADIGRLAGDPFVVIAASRDGAMFTWSASAPEPRAALETAIRLMVNSQNFAKMLRSEAQDGDPDARD